MIRNTVRGCLLLLFLSLAIQEIRSVDFWWQLRTGQWTVEHGSVPRQDEFTYTAHGNEFIEVRWLFYVLTYFGWSLGGPALLILAQALILAAAYLVALWPSRRTADSLPGAVLIALAIWAGSGRFVVRPEIVTFLMTAIFLVAIDAYRRGRIQKLIWVLPVAQAIWCNTHTEFILGPVFSWIFVAGDAVSSLFQKRPSADRRSIVPVALAVTAACLVNPYGIRGATFPLLLFREMHAGSVLGRVIGELRSPFGLEHWGWDIRASFVLMAASAFTFWLNRKRTDLPRLIAWAAILYLGVQSIRNLALFAFVGLWASLRNLDETIESGELSVTRRIRAAELGLAAVLVASVWYVVTDRYAVRFDTDRRFGLGIVPWRRPDAATRFLLSSGAAPQLFHEMSDGGYLDWAAKGRFPVFIDGRNEVFGEAFINDYLGMATARRDWDAFANRWEIRSAMLLRDEMGDLVDVVRRSPQWVLVYLDQREIIFVRDVPEHAALIAAHRIDPRAPWIPKEAEPDERPSGWRAAIGGVGRPWYSLGIARSLIHVGAMEAAVAYLERANTAFPDDRDTRLTLAQAYRSRGQDDRAAALLKGIAVAPDEAANMDLMLASLALDQDRPNDAIAPLQRATAAKPVDALLWAMLGKAYLDTRRYAEAATAYRHATERSRGTADYWVGLGHSLAMSQDDAGALAAYSEVLRIDPARYSILYNMGVLLRRRGDLNGAAARFREALRIRPDYEPARDALSELSQAR